MALISLVVSPSAAVLALGAAIAYYLVPYLVGLKELRGIPGPFLASFSNFWLLSACRRGKRYYIVDQAHKKWGPVVRIAPNHVSIADAEAIQVIYGHGNGFLKSDFYDPFVSIRRGLFNTRSRAEHTRKRKLVSHTFAPKSVLEFEPYVRQNLELFVKRWDEVCRKPESDGFAQLNCLSWFNYLAFDTIADLAFGRPFGMLSTGTDMAEIKATPKSSAIYAPAVEIMNRRGEVSATLGCLPGLKPYAKWLPDPFFSRGLEAVQNLAGIAIARVSERLENPPDIDRKDLLARLMEGRDEHGNPLGSDELTAEALTQLIAGSDTTSNSSTALMFHVVNNPAVLSRLRDEIDDAVPDDNVVPRYDQVKNLPYLGAVINETLRIHSPSGIGLPREIPPGSPGIELHGRHFPAGTVLSVPTYSVHHSKDIWGLDADYFRPERWENLTIKQKNAFIPFSYGPRSCVGRNLAEMQMRMIVGTWVKRYDVVSRQSIMETREGFLRKPMDVMVGIKLR